MKSPPWPADEAARLNALRSYQVLDTEPELGFDDLTAVAAKVCKTPIALVSLIDAHRQWFKSHHGLSATETPRDVAFCAHAILQPEPLIVPDSHLDARFADNPLVTDAPHVRFYAGMPLVTPSGSALGTLCVIDHVPRELDADQLDTLQRLGRQVMTQLELRRMRRVAESSLAAKARFLARAGHELRTPLTGVMGAIELLAGSELPPEQHELVAMGNECAHELLRVVKDVMDFSELENGHVAPERAAFDLRALCRQVLAALSEPARLKGLELRLDWRTALDQRRVGDEPRLRQLLTNLVGSAIKATAAGSVTLDIVDAEPAPALCFTVADTREGGPPESSRERHDAWASADEGAAAGAPGLGLGQAINRELARLMGGELHIESERGRGSRVRFTAPLPLAVADAPLRSSASQGTLDATETST